MPANSRWDLIRVFKGLRNVTALEYTCVFHLALCRRCTRVELIPLSQALCLRESFFWWACELFQHRNRRGRIGWFPEPHISLLLYILHRTFCLGSVKNTSNCYSRLEFVLQINRHCLWTSLTLLNCQYHCKVTFRCSNTKRSTAIWIYRIKTLLGRVGVHEINAMFRMNTTLYQVHLIDFPEL